MIHSNKFKSSYSLYLSREDLFSTCGGGIGDVGPSTTHLSSKEVDFDRDRHYGRFQPYLYHCTVLNTA